MTCENAGGEGSSSTRTVYSLAPRRSLFTILADAWSSCRATRRLAISTRVASRCGRGWDADAVFASLRTVKAVHIFCVRPSLLFGVAASSCALVQVKCASAGRGTSWQRLIFSLLAPVTPVRRQLGWIWR